MSATARSSTPSAAARFATPSSAMVAEAVTRRYHDVVAVDEVSLSIAPGEVVALVGLNGSGKTTLMRMLLGMAVPDSGSIRWWGTPTGRAGRAIWSRVGHLIETPMAYPELTVAENLRIAARLHGVAPHSITAAVGAAIDALDLADLRSRRCGALSLGNRQRVGLASAVVHSPDFLVLDEPTNALDPAAVVRLRELINERVASGVAVLVSSHHLDEVARIATRTLVMHRGRLVGEFGRGNLETDLFALAYADDVARGLAPARPS